MSLRIVPVALTSLLLTFSTGTLFSQSTDTVVVAGPEYSRSKFSRKIWGDHYREVWTTPIRVPFLDHTAISGGLTPRELGGGRQTRSLQFEGADGNEYVARSVNKDPQKAIPGALQGTFAEDIVKDQVSSAHPYGAMVVPKLADAIGVFHPSPALYYVRANPGLGEFSEEFNDLLVMLELRPDKDAISLSHYSDVDKSEKLFEKLSSGSHTQVDQEFYLRNRLFDMLLGDWDRHADQFKWGEIKDGDLRTFYALPKDRDQVFTLFDGIIPGIASKRWAVRELEHYHHEFGDLKGLNMPARNIDRRLLVNLERDAWTRTAEYIMTNITDEVIDAAVRDLPPEIYPINGADLAFKLKSRRNSLKEVADEYYTILAEKVDIPGSDEPESFYVERLNDGNTRVTGVNRTKDVPFVFYSRLFHYGETDEIRIYGMGGADSVIISGDVKRGMKIRVMPGTGDDVVEDHSRVKGLFNKTKVYTHKGSGLALTRSGETKLIRVGADSVFSYSDTAAKYSYLGPVLSLEFNIDDGLFVGGGVIIKREGFRKEPWGSVHRITLNYASQFSSYNARYRGIFYSKFGKFIDFGLLAEASGPKYIMNYFGEGNESEQTEKINYYRLRQNTATIVPSLIYRISRKFRIETGPFLTYNLINDSPGRFFGDSQFEYADEVNTPFQFTGGILSTYLNTANDSLNPTSGITWYNHVRPTFEIGGGAQFTNLNSTISMYYRPFSGPFIFAHRVGAMHNVGDYRFFQANFLGGTTNLRGFRRERFAGRTAVYLNNEIRMRVSRFRTYIIAGEWGLFGFADGGRVWADGEQSDVIHLGYGPGIWVNFLNMFLLSGSYGFSKEGGMVNVNTGFLF